MLWRILMEISLSWDLTEQELTRFMELRAVYGSHITMSDQRPPADYEPILFLTYPQKDSYGTLVHSEIGDGRFPSTYFTCTT